MQTHHKIQTLTVRFPTHLYDRICREAEQFNITNAEAIRNMALQYFTTQDEGIRLDAMEATIINAVKESEQAIRKEINTLVAE